MLPPMAQLVVVTGPLEGKVFAIDPGLTIGREAHNTIAMPDNKQCSRDHAKVWREGPNAYAVADLGSTNGTLVNDEKISRQTLKDGDVIAIGEISLRFELGVDEKPKPKPAAPKATLAEVLSRQGPAGGSVPGGRGPGLVEADDDGLYVLKFRGAGQGAKALLAEIVAGELARAAGLPVPEIVFVELDPELGRAEPDPEIQELIAASGGLQRRARLPARLADLQPGRRRRARPGARGRDRLARRADHERRPVAAEPEPAALARPPVADRPRRRALPPARVGRPAGRRAAAVPGDPQPRAAAVRGSIEEADARLAPRLTPRRPRPRAGARPRRLVRAARARAEYVEYLCRRLEAPRGFAAEAEAARNAA